jgi:hypothetical protein
MEKAGELILKIFKRLLERSRTRQGNEGLPGLGTGNLIRGWEQCLDPKDCGHSKIVDFVQNSLLVEVDHPAWLQVLKLKETIILKKLKIQFPELNIRYIKFFIKKEANKGDAAAKTSDLETGKSEFKAKLDLIMENLKKEP